MNLHSKMTIETYKPASPAEQEMFDYLLGQMSDSSVEELEKRYFSDEDVFNLMVSVKEELIDSYINDRLSPHDRDLFERNFMNSPLRREEVEFARQLKESINADFEFTADEQRLNSRASRNYMPFLTSWKMSAAIMTALLICSGWLIIQNRRINERLNLLENEKARLEQREKELLSQIERRPEPPPVNEPSPLPDEILAINLDILSTRGDDVPTFRMKSAKTRLDLTITMTFDPGNTSCRAVLKSTDGRAIDQTFGLKARERGVVLYIKWKTAANLPADTYELTVTGRDINNEPRSESYRFALIR